MPKKSYTVNVPARPKYTVTVASSGREVRPGETVTDFRGEPATFVRVTRRRQAGKSAKIAVQRPDGCEHEFYAHVYGLAVDHT